MDCKIPMREAIPRNAANNRTDLQWKRPDDGCYKVNCCAIDGKGDYKTGISVVIRNCRGKVMASCAQYIDGSFDGVVAVNGGHRLSNYGHILDEIEVLKRNNPGTKFRSTSKVANRVAQWLAKYGLESTDNMFWMEDVPVPFRPAPPILFVVFQLQILSDSQVRGDWKSAISFINNDPDALTAQISLTHGTVLHVAAMDCQLNFTLMLVELLSTPQSIAVRNSIGITVLHYVALSGSLRTAKALIEKNQRPSLFQKMSYFMELIT
ncbi:hypothetical protein QYF36_000433 [Acer negundo]|nr:hypothetical protein QYF36_000433 [Acer negundo]